LKGAKPMNHKAYSAANNEPNADTNAVHREYFSQFVTEDIKSRVLSSIGGMAIINSTDEHMNDIPLKEWDATLIPCPASVVKKAKELGENLSQSILVCIAKEAAKQIKELAYS
jgi:hypothetical protein